VACAALVVARGALGGEPPDRLAETLGASRAGEVQALLLERALGWAREAAPGRVSVLVRERVGVPGARTLIANGAGPTGRLANAALLALQGGDGPLLIAWPDLPVWHEDHASAALDDLAAGCQIALGPVFDGGLYLLVMARPLPALLSRPVREWRGADALGIAFAAAHRAGLEAGMLRAERGLRTPEDVRAALADPLLDPELRGLLNGGRHR
jgi:glycosyltransferase A (GT-A) superfamily protein (DUF2064 family)